MKIKTSQLIDSALDWAVAKAEGLLEPSKYYDKMIPRVVVCDKTICDEIVVRLNPIPDVYYEPFYNPSNNWEFGGPIIERIKGFEFKHWLESKPETCCEAHIHNYEGDWIQFGSTPLQAAMRCYVASKLGEEVDIPDELVKEHHV